MISKRKNRRYIRRFETEFTANDQHYRAFSSDFSISGLFIRTNHAFVPGTILDVTIHLPNSKSSKVRGRVKRALKTPAVYLKNGMGIELLEADSSYREFINSFDPDSVSKSAVSEPSFEFKKPNPAKERSAEPPFSEFQIIACPNCGVKNKVNTLKLALGPKCGKCRSPLFPSA